MASGKQGYPRSLKSRCLWVGRPRLDGNILRGGVSHYATRPSEMAPARVPRSGALEARGRCRYAMDGVAGNFEFGALLSRRGVA